MTRNDNTTGYTAAGAISLVTKRELRGNLMKKGILITLALSIVMVVGGIIAAAYFAKDDSAADESVIAVVGDAPFATSVADVSKLMAEATHTKDTTSGETTSATSAVPFGAAMGGTLSPIAVKPASDEADARAMVDRGDAVAALVPGEQPQQWTLIDKDAPQWLPGLLQEALTDQLRNKEIVNQGGDPAAIAAAASQGQIGVKPFDEQPDVNVAALLVVGIGIALSFMGIMMFGGAVAQSVIEEKSSRVVEIMLSTVRPLHLLTGKLLGSGIAGLLMLLAILVSGAGALMATGLAKDFEIPWAAVGLLVPFYIFGYFFFAALYAMAGSLVSRMEDFQGTQTPVMLLSLVTIYVPAFGWSALDSTAMKVMAWIPPISITTAPLQYAMGNMSAIEVLAAAALLMVACIGVLFLASRIYPRTVLHTGAPVSWKKALTSKKN